MKRIYIVVVVCVLALMIFILENNDRQPLNIAQPNTPPFPISMHYDGKWEGERRDISGDNICLETRVVGTIEQGVVNLKLMYNNTLLSGWVSNEGDLALYANSPRWGYRFMGTAKKDRIDGEWRVTNAPCHGTWNIKKVSGL
ncbi:hypothetical protein RJ45_23650 [Photobacterium gaetbulicola]|uniref:Uncharacterized protein n=1 Tax=Photobacterium gaetbulicola TaxID=1295392 RepID=A0A0B9GN06_9GAMM|nr:hypothetical protein [Photobacterium gaetbulicola]KHT60226.1 hypothetical protein RJ45_23650 [Photobacterium gaetbulicola]